MMFIVSLLRKKIRGRLKTISQQQFSHINWVKTVAFNFWSFDFKIAVKLPVYIYNDVDIIVCNKVVINGAINSGMIKIGSWKSKAQNNTRIINHGTIIFNGPADIWGGCIVDNSGELVLGDHIMFAEGCMIMCMQHIIFGDYIRVGYHTTFMDTDYHFTIDVDTKCVRRNEKTVRIGAGSWISSNCRIMKGSVLPCNSVVGGSTLINKDYSEQPKCTIFVGSPGKPVKTGFRRLFNIIEEQKAIEYFREHPEANSYQLKTDDIDKLCFDNFFKK